MVTIYIAKWTNKETNIKRYQAMAQGSPISEEKDSYEEARAIADHAYNQYKGTAELKEYDGDKGDFIVLKGKDINSNAM